MRFLPGTGREKTAFRVVTGALPCGGIALGLMFWAALAGAGEDRPLGLKPWLLSPPPERLSPLDAQRAYHYRLGLQAEIRRLQLQRFHGDRRSFHRLQSARRELSRIRRAAGR